MYGKGHFKIEKYCLNVSNIIYIYIILLVIFIICCYLSNIILLFKSQPLRILFLIIEINT